MLGLHPPTFPEPPGVPELGRAGGGGRGVITGLEWDGLGSSESLLYWQNPFPIYDASYCVKVLPHQKNAPSVEPHGYYTTLFWARALTFNGDHYYGFHPYPVPPTNGEGHWEISVYGDDEHAEDPVDWDRWHNQAFRAWRESAAVTQHEFYYDLPDTDLFVTRPVNDVSWAAGTPSDPHILVGQAPWGGTGREEHKGVLRGFQFYEEQLSVAHLTALAALETDAEVLAYCSVNSITSLWYLNMNPTPGDVTDKSGNGNHGTWAGTPAALWTGTI